MESSEAIPASAARSSYVPNSSRPPFLPRSHSGSTATYQPTRPPPAPPLSRTPPPSNYAPLYASPTRSTPTSPSQPLPLSPPRRPPPPTLNTSLRDLTDVLPRAAPPRSNNSSSSDLPTTQSTTPYHARQQSYSHSLLNDPATQAAALAVMNEESTLTPSRVRSSGYANARDWGQSSASGSTGSAAPFDPASPNPSNGKDRSDKGSTIKGVFGSILGQFTPSYPLHPILTLSCRCLLESQQET